MTPEEKRLKRNARIKQWRKDNPDKVQAAKKKFYASEKGKLCKQREDAAYIASGGRAKAEQRRAEKPLSEARKQARAKWSKANKPYWAAQRSLRRGLVRILTEEDRFVVLEAANLAALRTDVFGFQWHVDHIVPVTKGGTSCADNLQVVPASWNRKKSNKHQQRFFAC